ncbi:MAG: nitroreductase family protein [Actinomycetota bacterium]
MTEFDRVVRGRRMTRAFSSQPIEPDLLDELVDLASRSPSAGKTQGWHLLVLEGGDARRYWDVTFPAERRSGFAFPHLFDAPVIAIPLADPDAYVERYAEPDKARSGLGSGVDAWAAPYWTIDGSMAVMTLLLAAENVGLGALFFGVFDHEPAVRAEFGIPDRLQVLGALALGWPHESVGETTRAGRSASRARRAPDQIIRRGRWTEAGA